jgi:hypothetical protein
MAINALNAIILQKLGDSPTDDSIHIYNLDNVDDPDIPEHITPEYIPMEIENSMPEADKWDVEAYDNYISTEVRLPKNGSEVIGTVVSRKKDRDGNPIRKSNTNPILDTRLYQVMFPEGKMAEYTANVIAECLYSQVDNEGRQYLLLEDTIDWKKTIFSRYQQVGMFINDVPPKGGSYVCYGKMGLHHGRTSRI